MRTIYRRRPNWRRFTLTVVTVALTLLAVRYGVLLVGHLVSERRPVNVTDPQTITAETTIIQVTTYRICGHDQRDVVPVGQTLLGMNADQVKARFPGWTLASYSSKQVELRRSAEICTFHDTNRLVLMKDDGIGIYYGTVENPGPLIRPVDSIDPTALTSDDRRQLQAGVSFYDTDPRALEEQIQAFLEGMND